VNATRKLKLGTSGGVAKASLNRAISGWYSDVKRVDLSLARMKLG
jgi:hypothetical protein